MAVGERFSGRLEFGTAGLRGALGAGPMRMNRVVVIRAAAGARRVPAGTGRRQRRDRLRRAAQLRRLRPGHRGRGHGSGPFRIPAPPAAADTRTRVRDKAPRRERGRDGDGFAQSRYRQRIQGVSRGRLPRSSRRRTWRYPRRSTASARCDDRAGGRCGRFSGRTCSTPTWMPSPTARPPAPRDSASSTPRCHGVGGDVLLAAFARAGFPAPKVVLSRPSRIRGSRPSHSPTRRSPAPSTSRSRRPAQDVRTS